MWLLESQDRSHDRPYATSFSTSRQQAGVTIPFGLQHHECMALYYSSQMEPCCCALYVLDEEPPKVLSEFFVTDVYVGALYPARHKHVVDVAHVG